MILDVYKRQPLALAFDTDSYFYGMLPVMIGIGEGFGIAATPIAVAMAVSYTHLDVYKRQHVKGSGGGQGDGVRAPVEDRRSQVGLGGLYDLA